MIFTHTRSSLGRVCRVSLRLDRLDSCSSTDSLVSKDEKPSNLGFDGHHSQMRWRRRQDSNLWYPFGVQRFSKPPLSAAQPRLRNYAEKPGFNSSGGANFVKVNRIIRPNNTCLWGLTHLLIAPKIQGLLGTPLVLFQFVCLQYRRVFSTRLVLFGNVRS